MEMFGHAHYLSEDLLLPHPHTYFLIDFKGISNTVLEKVGGNCPQIPPSGQATDRDRHDILHKMCVAMDVAALILQPSALPISSGWHSCLQGTLMKRRTKAFDFGLLSFEVEAYALL